MKKNFQLPKEFATKWLAALRSGDYKQGRSALAEFQDILLDTKPVYCCLGVACAIQGVPDIAMRGLSFPRQIRNVEFSLPESLKNSWDREQGTTLAGVLASLNDGAGSTIKLPNGEKLTYNEKGERHSFEQIADWIEENVELVEETKAEAVPELVPSGDIIENGDIYPLYMDDPHYDDMQSIIRDDEEPEPTIPELEYPQ